MTGCLWSLLFCMQDFCPSRMGDKEGGADEGRISTVASSQAACLHMISKFEQLFSTAVMAGYAFKT